jgi:hypothetical protein
MPFEKKWLGTCLQTGKNAKGMGLEKHQELDLYNECTISDQPEIASKMRMGTGSAIQQD